MERQNKNKKNPIFIKEIILRDYLTYKDLKIEFSQNIQTLVGPNECGKTNLLSAFEKLYNPGSLNTSYTCYYAENPVKTEPEIEFILNSTILREFIPLLNEKDLVLVIKGSEINPKTVETDKHMTKAFKISIKGTLPTGQIHFKCPEFLKHQNIPGSHLEQNKKYEIEILSREEAEKIQNFYENHPQKQNIEFKSEIIGISAGTEYKIEELLKEIKIIDWKYDETQYIPDIIPLNALMSNPEKYKSIINMFKIAGFEIQDLINITNQIVKKNILRGINEKVSIILNNSWTQYQDIKLNLTLGGNNTLEVSFLENDRITDPNTRSLGFKWFFAFLLHFSAHFGNEIKNCVILFDEPGIHLHPGGQRDLLKEIDKLALFNQIIYTTHLPFMINRNHPERIIYLNKEKGLTIRKEPRKKGIIDDLLLASTLGFSFTSISNFGEVNLFVEGITDKILIEEVAISYAQKFNEILFDLNYISIISTNGLSNLDSFIRVAQETEIKYLVLLDGDEKGKKKYDIYKKNPEKYNNAIDFFYILPDDIEIEDTIPIDLLKNAFEDLKKNTYPWNILIPKDKKLNDNKVTFQIKNLINELKNLTKAIKDESINGKQLYSSNDKNLEDITPGQLKLDLILSTKKLINEKNIEEFKELLEKLSNINKRAIELIKISRK